SRISGSGRSLAVCWAASTSSHWCMCSSPVALRCLPGARAKRRLTHRGRLKRFLGELGLDGALRHTTGILPMVALARERSIPTVSVPAVNALEAALIRNVAVIPVHTLAELVAHLRGEMVIAPAPSADELLDLAPPTH